VAEFNQLFLVKNGRLDCKDLLNYNFNIPFEAEKATELGLFDSLCPKLVGDSAQILSKILY